MNDDNLNNYLIDNINSEDSEDTEDTEDTEENLINERYSLDEEEYFRYNSINNFGLSEHDKNNLKKEKELNVNKEKYYNYYFIYDKFANDFMNYKQYKSEIISYSKYSGTIGDYWDECKNFDNDDNQDFSKYIENKEFNTNRILKFLKNTPLFRGLKENIEVYCKTKYKLLAYNTTLPNDAFTFMEETYPEYLLKYKSDRCPYLSCIANIEYICVKDAIMYLTLNIESIQFQKNRDNGYEKVGNLLECVFQKKNYFINIRPNSVGFHDGGCYNCGIGGSGLILLMQLTKFNEYKKNFIKKNKFDY